MAQNREDDEATAVGHHPRKGALADVGRARRDDNLRHTEGPADEPAIDRRVIAALAKLEVVEHGEAAELFAAAAQHERIAGACQFVRLRLSLASLQADEMAFVVEHVDIDLAGA